MAHRMPDAWTCARLGELVEFLSGGTPRKSEDGYWGGDIPWISGATLTELRLQSSERRLTQEGVDHGSRMAPKESTLILVRGMSLLDEIRIGHAVCDLAFNQDVKALVPKRIDPWFLTYALIARSQELHGMVHQAGHGTGVLATDRLKDLRMPIPPVEEQRRIAGVLGALDDLIDTNRRIAEESTALWRAVVRDALADASEATRLSELADFVNGKNFTKAASGHGRPVIRTPEVRRGPQAGTARSNVDAVDENIAREGDTLFVWSGSLTVGRWMWEEGLINQHVFKVLSKPNVPAWLVFALIEYQMPWFLSLAVDKATTMGHIKREHLDGPVPIPSSAEIKRLDQLVEPLWNEALQCGIAIQELSRARDELLPLLLSGRVRVGDVAA